jgi:hypothetical protein
MRFDRSSRRTVTMTGAEVASTAIVGLAETHRALWVAGSEDLAASLGDAGLFRLDLGARTWSRVTADSGGLPVAHPTALAASGDTLWVGTDDGVALYDERSGRWDVGWFHVEMVSDTAEGQNDRDLITIDHHFSLVTHLSASDEARSRLVIEIAEQIINNGRSDDPADTGARALDSVLATIRAVPPAHWDSALAAPSEVLAHAFANPALIAVATAGWLDADSSDITLDADVMRAIGFLRDRRYLPFLRGAWQQGSLPADEMFALASTLAQFRDTAAVRWLHETATKSPSWYQIEPAVDALAAVGDTVIGPAIAERLNEPGADQQGGPALLLWAFSRVATPAQWRAAMPSLAASGRLRLALLDRFDARRIIDSIVRSDSLTRVAAIEIARHELTTPGRTGKIGDGRIDRWAAADICVLLGDRDAVPYVMPLLTQSPQDYRMATTTLIQLTGVDSAPPWLAPTPSQRAVAQRFWTDWWAAHGPGLAPVPVAGKAALRRWRMRALGL